MQVDAPEGKQWEWPVQASADMLPAAVAKWHFQHNKHVWR
jgi:hypothetical protein